MTNSAMSNGAGNRPYCPNEHECSEQEIDFECELSLYCPICRKPLDEFVAVLGGPND